MSGLSESEREVLYPVVRKNVGAYMKIEQLIAQREAAAVAAFKAEVVAAIEARERELSSLIRRHQALQPATTRGHRDGIKDAARIVRTHPT